MIEPLSLSRLLQLASPMLPVGAYSYSQGLEAAIEADIVRDAEGTGRWIEDVLGTSLCRFELPMLWRLWQGWMAADLPAVLHWNQIFLAGRDTAESRAETIQMGYSLVGLLSSLPDVDASVLAGLKATPVVTFPMAYSAATAMWKLPVESVIHAYAWSWVENQVSVAMKAIPIGQVAGQRLLLALGAMLPAAVAHVIALADDDMSNFAPGLTLAGCRHETQYSRLFRS